MKRQTAVFIFCLQSWFFLSTNTTPPPELEQMNVPAESLSEITGKLPEKRLSPPVSVRAEVKSNADDLMIRNDETEDDSGDADTFRDFQETVRDPRKKRSFLDEKPQLRLVKRRYFGVIKNAAEPESRDHNLQKRQAVYSDTGNNFDMHQFLELLENFGNGNEHRRRIEAELKHRLRYLGTSDDQENRPELSEQENESELSLQTLTVNDTTTFIVNDTTTFIVNDTATFTFNDDTTDDNATVGTVDY